MDMSKKPLKVIKYCKIVDPEIAVHEVTQILAHNVKKEHMTLHFCSQSENFDFLSRKWALPVR